MNYPTTTASILLVGMGWFPTNSGGLDRYVYELANQLAIAQDQVDLCGVGLPEITSHPSLSLINLSTPETHLWQRLWQVKHQFLQRLRYTTDFDAINLHFALYSLPLLAHLPAKVPVTFTFHGPWGLESQWEGASQWNVWFKQWVEQRVYRQCDRFIVLSKAFGKILHEAYQIPWEQIHIIPGGVNTTHFQPTLSRQAARTQLNWHPDRPILLTPRRLVQRMGLDQLLQAIEIVKHQIPDIWLAIAGKGALQNQLLQQIQELELTDHVKLLGYLPDEQLPIAYQAADLMVMPSQSLEGFGLTLVESLACGTPVLCTPIGGMPEVVAPLNPDLVTTSADATAIAERLIQWLSGEVELPSRSACQTYACERFDWQIVAQQVRQVLLEPDL